MVAKVAAAVGACALVGASMLPAQARTTVIAQLGTSPLIGPMASTSEMQRRVRGDLTLLAQAGSQIGISHAQYVRFRDAVAVGDVRWVTIPRHLDAMSWASAGNVRVIHDVMIPANTNGWEVDIPEGDHVVALYVPAICGNLSLLRKPAVHVANYRPAPKPVVAAQPPPPAPEAPPVTAPAPEVAEAAVPAPAPVIAAPPPSRPKLGWLPLLIPFLLGGGGGSGGSTPSQGPMPCP